MARILPLRSVRGVDTTRFPEFTDEVKSAMYDEAVSFFEHIVRKDRPVREILHADYTFLNQPLAKHYGVKKEIKSVREPELVEGADDTIAAVCCVWARCSQQHPRRCAPVQ